MSPADSPAGPPPSIGPTPSPRAEPAPSEGPGPASPAGPGASSASAGPSPEPPPPAGYAARPLELADLEAVHRLELRLFPADAWPLEMFLAEVRHPARRYTVVLDRAGALVGYAGMMALAETGDVQTIAVDPGHEGRGLGRWLMQRMHRQAREAGAGTMMLEVRADNPRAAGLYESLGYARIHVRPRYYQDGVDAVIMSKDLTPEGGPRP